MLFAQCENDSLQAYNAMTSAMQNTPIYAENTGESMFSSSSPFSWNALGVHVVCLLRETTTTTNPLLLLHFYLRCSCRKHSEYFSHGNHSTALHHVCTLVLNRPKHQLTNSAVLHLVCTLVLNRPKHQLTPLRYI